mgnify:CR=1 FL=1
MLICQHFYWDYPLFSKSTSVNLPTKIHQLHYISKKGPAIHVSFFYVSPSP